jgi:hypothetical protein
LGPVPCPHRRRLSALPPTPIPHPITEFSGTPATPPPDSAHRRPTPFNVSRSGSFQFGRASAPVMPHRVQNHARAERRHRHVVKAVHLKEARSHCLATCCLTIEQFGRAPAHQCGPWVQRAVPPGTRTEARGAFLRGRRCPLSAKAVAAADISSRLVLTHCGRREINMVRCSNVS